jgi:hypothetical protein
MWKPGPTRNQSNQIHIFITQQNKFCLPISSNFWVFLRSTMSSLHNSVKVLCFIWIISIAALNHRYNFPLDNSLLLKNRERLTILGKVSVNSLLRRCMGGSYFDKAVNKSYMLTQRLDIPPHTQYFKVLFKMLHLGIKTLHCRGCCCRLWRRTNSSIYTIFSPEEGDSMVLWNISLSMSPRGVINEHRYIHFREDFKSHKTLQWVKWRNNSKNTR